MDERKSKSAADATCDRLGDLIGTAVPHSDLPPDPRQWSAIEARLTVRASPSRRWRARLLPAMALAAVALLAGGTWLYTRRPLDYRVDNCAVAADGALTAMGEGSVAFTDGSRITLSPGARLRVRPSPFASGAELALDEGAVELAVVHRARARWTVRAGPFRVEVTGTRFALRWSPDSGRLHLAMQEGSVHVTGGPLAAGARLHAGQTLAASPTHFSVLPAPAGSGPPAATPAPPGPAPIAPVQAESDAVPHRPPASHAPASRRKPARIGRPEAAREPSPGGEETRTLAWPTLPAPAPAPTSAESEPAAAPARSGAHRIGIAADGGLSDGMTGFAWLAGGAGTTFSSSLVRAEHTRLRPVDGQLCARGTIAGMRCVNDGLPQMRCNWEQNWGAAIGLFVRADRAAWGMDAASAIAVEFHGRAHPYRLNAHRAGDPQSKVYCIDDYRSGEAVRPTRFTTECWSDAGEALSDFESVDFFNLQWPSGHEYVAFRYCIVGVRVIP